MQLERLNHTSIAMFAKKIRDIQNTQIEPYFQEIVSVLNKMYPNLANEDDDTENWASDIISSDSDEEVFETLNRLKSIQDKKTNWTCAYCGKDTSDVEYDYLAEGNSHLGCVLSQKIKEDKTKVLEKEIAELHVKLKELENYIERIRGDYHHEPSN